MIIPYLLSPLITTIFYAIAKLNNSIVNKKHLWVISLMLSVYLGFLNSTKELLGDFEAYYIDFISVPKNNLISYVLDFGKEPIYTVFTYISYYIFAGTWELYVISLTSINYLLISYCIIKTSEYLKINFKNSILVLFFMAFFFQEFAAIGNIMRQGPAQALVMLFLTIIYIEKKYCWWIALCALLTHTSVLPIIGIGLIPSLQNKFKIKSIIKTFILLFVLVFIFFFFESVLSKFPFIGYIYQRANNTDALFGADSWQEQLGFNSFTFSIVSLLSIISMFLYYKFRNYKEIPAAGVININIVLLLFIIICDAVGAYYLFMRYFFFIYTFQNILILYFIHKINLKNNYIRVIIMLSIIVYFFYCYTHNVFEYAPIGESLLNPLLMYI